jgi:hypothetical protein
MQFSTVLRAAQADLIESILGTAPKLQFFDGTKPALTTTADAGTKIVDTALPSDWLTNPGDGTKAKNGTWSLSGIANGFARYWRLKDSTGTTCVLQGYIGQNWAASSPWSLNQHCINDSGKVYKVTTAGNSAGSGGPTGTGTGITDGTVVWDYVGVSSMVLDNTSVTNAQGLTVNTFLITMGNA